MKMRTLGRAGPSVSAIGMGCMGMSWAYGGSSDEAESIASLHKAVEAGITFFDTAEVYGPFNNEEIVGRGLKGVRDKVFIATKFGYDIPRDLAPGTGRPGFGMNSRPDHIKRVVDESLQRLGTDRIDLYYQHRVDPNTPIEDTVGALKDLIAEGKVLNYGLSEASPATVRRAHAVHPCLALQSEYSLWTRDPESNGVLETCRELGVGFVSYSPLGRGILAGGLNVAADDRRSAMPRFQGENLARNQALVDNLTEVAKAKGCTPAQLALAWVLAQGEDIVPIPGMRRAQRVDENVAATEIELSGADLAAIDQAIPAGAVAGDRYPAQMMSAIDR